MTELQTMQSVPMTRAGDGVFRITGTRFTLDSVVHQFKSGATAEQIQEDFPSVTLSDVYSVIAYYLQNTRAVEAYLAEQSQAAKELKREIEGSFDAGDLRERLRKQRARATA